MKEWFKETVQRLTKAHRLWVAFSGGMDSHVLLDLTVRAFANHSDYQIGAIHIHDGLSIHADAWVVHCQTICQVYGIPLEVRWIDATPKRKQSPEESSRIARYHALQEVLHGEDCLLLAHHQEDQAETILLRLFRGAGPTGLSGMKEHTILQGKEMIRPLLSVSKAQLTQYAQKETLEWVEDDLNEVLQFDRNYVRHCLMPLIKKRWPKVTEAVVRSARLCAETAVAIEDMMQEKLLRVAGPEPYLVSISALGALSAECQRHVLRLWLKQLGYPMPSQPHLYRILREVVQARPDAKPRLKIDHYEIYRVKQYLGVRPWQADTSE